MRNFILSVFLFLGYISLFGQESRKEVYVMFHVSDGELDAAYGGNAARLSEIISFLDNVKNDDMLDLVEVSFCGSASPDGNFKLNKKLATERLYSLELYVRQRVAIPDNLITRREGGVAWEYLATLVEKSDMPHKEETLHVLRYVPEFSYSRNYGYEENRKWRLMELQDGQTWDYMMEHFFEQARNASAVLVTVRRKPELPPVVQKPEPEEPEEPVIEIPVVVQPVDTIPLPEELKPFYMSLKTNMLYDALLIPNIGAEFYLGKDWSIAGNWMYSWWKSDERHRYWRTYGGDLAVRKWFGAKANEKPLTGHHIGLYAQILTYDIEFGGKGYLGDRWSYAGGIEYGYSQPVGNRLNLDFTLGVGYLGGEYETYKPIDGHYVWQSTRNRHWFGPTKAEISLVWLIGRGNSNNKKGGLK